MATLTVREAARRLGVKPDKVRLYISQRKLSARPAPHAPDLRPGDRILLDADEVDTLAEMRAQKRRRRAGEPSTNGGSAHPPTEPGAPAAVAARGEEIAPPAEPLPEQAVPTVDRAGWQAAVVIQPLLQPLVVELHDARETIRRQAEELGALRATVADLQRRLQVASDGGATAPALAHGSASHENAPLGAGRPRTLAAATPRHIPLWQRALAHWLR
jgi:excisionase family DNA binding protein